MSKKHRSCKNTINEILEKHYWPELKKDVKKYNNKCSACLFGRYERYPIKEPLCDSTIPTQPREFIHADIYYNNKTIYLTTMDKFSKYIVAREIENVLEEIITKVSLNVNV